MQSKVISSQVSCCNGRKQFDMASLRQRELIVQLDNILQPSPLSCPFSLRQHHHVMTHAQAKSTQCPSQGQAHYRRSEPSRSSSDSGRRQTPSTAMTGSGNSHRRTSGTDAGVSRKSEPSKSSSDSWPPANMSRPERARATMARSSLSRECSSSCCARYATSALPLPKQAYQHLSIISFTGLRFYWSSPSMMWYAQNLNLRLELLD